MMYINKSLIPKGQCRKAAIKVKQSSEKAGNSATKAGKTAEEAGKKAKKAGEDAGKGGRESEKSGNKWAEFGKKIEKAGTKVTGIGKKIEKAGDAVGKVGKKFAPLSAAAAGTLTAVTKGASDFQNGMAKMSTLFDTSQVSVQKLSKEFLNLSNETGKSAVELTEAGYQALSASVPVKSWEVLSVHLLTWQKSDLRILQHLWICCLQL